MKYAVAYDTTYHGPANPLRDYDVPARGEIRAFNHMLHKLFTSNRDTQALLATGQILERSLERCRYIMIKALIVLADSALKADDKTPPESPREEYLAIAECALPPIVRGSLQMQSDYASVVDEDLYKRLDAVTDAVADLDAEVKRRREALATAVAKAKEEEEQVEEEWESDDGSDASEDANDQPGQQTNANDSHAAAA